MRDYKFEDKKRTDESEDLSKEIAYALSRMKKHKANGTTVEEVAAAIREVESMIRSFEIDERTLIEELSKLSVEELKKRRDQLIARTRFLLKDLYISSMKICKNVRIIKFLNKLLEKKLLENQSS